MYMEVDIQIYVRRLKDFFDTDEEARRDMFGITEIDMDEFYKMVADKATINFKKNGDPMLSSTELLGIVTDLAFKEIHQELDINKFIQQEKQIEKLFVNIKDGFPPFCLN